jgi:hypothetical protein
VVSKLICSRGLTFVMIVSLIVAGAGCNQSRTAVNGGAMPMTSVDLKEVKALNDPSNPFAGQYSEWDTRAFEVVTSLQSKGVLSQLSEQATGLADNATGTHNFDYYVDERGFLVPKLLSIRIREDFYADGSRESMMDPYKSFAHIFVPIKMSDEDYSRFNLTADKIVAEYFPSIPKWLADSPPVGGAIIYPKGEVVCFGAPASSQSSEKSGSHMDDEDMSQSTHSSKIFLYNSQGRLLAQSDDPAPITVFAPHLGGYGLGGESFIDKVSIQSTRDGYFILRDNKTHAVVRVVDYDGKPVSSVTIPPLRDLHNFFNVSADMLHRIYVAQQIPE